MKQEILYGAIAVIATIIVTANAQNTNNGYQFPSVSQSYPGNDPQQTTGANNLYYYNNSKGNWVQPVLNPYSNFLRNWQYGQNYNTPPQSTVTWTDDNRRLGKEVPENRRVIPSNTPIVQIESRLASQNDEVARQTLLDRADSRRLAVIPLQKEEGVARFANTKPDVAVTSNPDSIVFRDRQMEEAPVMSVVDSNVSIALTGFGLTTMKLLNAEPTRNPSISPYSIAQLLALLQQGAAGNSQLEITQALLMTPSNTKEAFRALLNSIKSRSSRNVLKTATNIFVNSVFDLDRTFKNTAVRTFDSDVTPTNFNEALNAARQINSWIAEKTQNYIRELISADMLEGNTQLVLANAIFFKGIWQSRFDPKNTTSGDFLLSDGNVKRVQYMRARLGLPVGLDRQTGIRYAVMPFEGEQYKMMFLIPEVDDLKTAINKLTTEKLLNFLSVTIKDVRAAIPKFTVQSDMDLKTVFNKMGIREIFGSQSNLYNVGTYRTISPQVTSALHKAVVSIDEQGGTAAAVTVFPAVALSFEDSTIAFNLNKPFLMILWDAENRVPLFMSRVDDPSM